ncbi:MAG: PIN domain-containing protein [Gemmatimonadota bacterium]
MIVADTGAVIALIDRDDHHHAQLREAFEAAPTEWLLPWAILPEVDYLLASRVGANAAASFRADVAAGLFVIEWSGEADLGRAVELERRYAQLSFGLVDAVVMATAERMGARAIATLDLRDFAAVELVGHPELWPRDLPTRALSAPAPTRPRPPAR